MWAWIYKESGLINMDRTDRIWIQRRPEDSYYYLKARQNGTECIIDIFDDYDSAVGYLNRIAAGLKIGAAVLPK